MDESLSSNMASKSVNVPETSDESEAHNPPLEYPIIEDFDCKLGIDDDFVENYTGPNYTVWLPPTPDNQPMDSPERFDNHKRRKLNNSVDNHPYMAGAKSSRCAIWGCDSELMHDEHGVDILPCECDFKICEDCYIDAVELGDGMCPGCKAPYNKNT